MRCCSSKTKGKLDPEEKRNQALYLDATPRVEGFAVSIYAHFSHEVILS